MASEYTILWQSQEWLRWVPAAPGSMALVEQWLTSSRFTAPMPYDVSLGKSTGLRACWAVVCNRQVTAHHGLCRLSMEPTEDIKGAKNTEETISLVTGVFLNTVSLYIAHSCTRIPLSVST